LRYVLRALASEPGFFQTPHEAIARLRPQVDAERRRLTHDFEIEGSSDERQRDWTRLADGAVIGLSYLARLCVNAGTRSAVAPFALMAVGKYGARGCDADITLEVQYLLSENQESWERSGQIFAFICRGLAELGFEYQGTVGTAVECARTARCDAVAAARFATARFLSGQYGLHAGFVAMCRAVAPRAPSMPAGPDQLLPVAMRRHDRVDVGRD
jgi:UTP:GlnB (protein PII) uridylyltransferase